MNQMRTHIGDGDERNPIAGSLRLLSLLLNAAAIAGLALVIDSGMPANAAPISFMIDFTQTSTSPSIGPPPTGHFSIDVALINSGADHFLQLTAIPDFVVVDGAAVFPSNIWFGFLHIPPAGLGLHIQGLPTDDPGSNAIAEISVLSNDPKCLGAAIMVPGFCEFALGSHPGNPWAEVFTDRVSNLVVATGSYSILQTSVPEPNSAALLGAGIIVLFIATRTRRADRGAGGTRLNGLPTAPSKLA